MWSPKQPRPDLEAPIGVKAFREKSNAAEPENQSLQRPPEGGPAADDLPKATADAPALPMELRGGRDLQTAQFKPDRRQLARSLVIAPGAPSSVYSTYNILRTEIIQRLRQNRWNTVAITSPSRRSGNTLTAINLAISIARDFGQTVLLVELNFVNPSFQRVLGFEPRKGMVDYLLHDAPPSEILLDIGIERLAVIPAGSPVANSSELLSSPQMARFVEELKRRYGRQIVLFDLPSVLAVDDAMAFAPFVDCALIVVDEGETRVNDVRRALRRLESTKILGIVLNRSLHGENEVGVVSR
jgi:protein-tyrosine kinase